jgi:hypothetical protein
MIFNEIIPIGGHQLDTSNIEALAKGLSARLDLSIQYGYFNHPTHNELLGFYADDSYMPLGEVIRNPAEPTYFLTDDNFQQKALYEKYGWEILYDKRYWLAKHLPSEQRIEEEKVQLARNNYALTVEIPHLFGEISIGNDLFSVTLDYYSDWDTLSREFNEGFFPNMEKLTLYRKQLQYCCTRLGGDTMYYMYIQGRLFENIQQQNGEIFLNWEEFKTYVESGANDLLLDISRYFNDPDYKTVIMEAKERPLVFRDDFSDLEDDKGFGGSMSVN